MSLGRLIDFFGAFTKLPVYAEDVLAQLLEMGVQDRITFQKFDKDPKVLLGLYLKYHERSGLYGEAESCSVIFYNQNVNPDMQNFICIKEMMHVFDNEFAAVKNREDLHSLVSDLFSPDFLQSDPGPNALFGFFDEIARFSAYAVMFPCESRDDFIVAHSKGMEYDEIAARVGLDARAVRIILSPQWEVILNHFRTTHRSAPNT